MMGGMLDLVFELMGGCPSRFGTPWKLNTPGIPQERVF